MWVRNRGYFGCGRDSPDDEGLAEADLGGLVDGFVGQGAGSRDDTDTPALVDETGHDANLTLAGRLRIV